MVPGTAAQNSPRVQISPWWMGLGVSFTLVNVGDPESRFVDCPTNTFQSAFASPVGSFGLPYGVLPTSVGVSRYATSTWPGFPAAIAAKKWVPWSVLTRYGTPVPSDLPFQVVPPSKEASTQMSYSVRTFMTNPTYGFPRLSSVRSAKISDPSCKSPASYTGRSVQDRPPSSEYADQIEWNAASWVRLQPLRGLSGSAANQAM